MKNENNRDKKALPYNKLEYQNVLFSVPLTRWERYYLAVQRFRNESPKGVFFESESSQRDFPSLGDKQDDEKGIRGDFASVDTRTGSTARGQHLIISNTIGATYGKGDNTPNNKTSRQRIFLEDRIRLLTPIECERLMSWPDNHTKWGMNEKGEKVEISDSQRYKMCGNGVVSNVVREIAKVLLAPPPP